MKLNRLHQAYVWLRRISHCRGFGIQSPTDYRFVRYVVNEHWPYYAYESLGQNDDWLRRKLGLLYFRLANDQDRGSSLGPRVQRTLGGGVSGHLAIPGILALYRARPACNGHLRPLLLRHRTVRPEKNQTKIPNKLLTYEDDKDLHPYWR